MRSERAFPIGDYVQDKKVLIPLHRPNLTEKFFFFASGIVTSVPLTLFVGTFTDSLCVVLPTFYATLCSLAIFTPFVEEFAKAYPLFYRHGETEKSIFALGLLVGLGFGVSEFLLYVIAFGTPFYVRLPGLVFHAGSTSITAYGIAKKQPVRFYLIAAALHFTNNISVLLDPFPDVSYNIGGAAVLAITLLLTLRLHNKTSETIVD